MFHLPFVQNFGRGGVTVCALVSGWRRNVVRDRYHGHCRCLRCTPGVADLAN